MVFDRAAVIAPQRPRRVSIIKTSTSERDSLPKGKKCCMGGGSPKESKSGKDIYSFCVNNFYICGEITTDVFLRSFGALKSLAPSLPRPFPLTNLFFFLPSNLFSFHLCQWLCFEKHESEAKALGSPRASTEALFQHAARCSKAPPVFSPVESQVFRVIHSNGRILCCTGS